MTRWSKRAGMAASLRSDEPHPHRLSKDALLRMRDLRPRRRGCTTPAPAARTSLAWSDDARPRRTAGRPGTPGATPRSSTPSPTSRTASRDPGHEHDDQALVRTAWRRGARTTPTTTRCRARSTRRTKRRLQIELLKLQAWVKDTGERLVILFEGRDAAGKGGTIKRFMEHLNPRGARVVALEKPTERERGAVVLPALRRSTCRRPARSCCSTGPGTTGPAWSGSWASARRASTWSSCAQAPEFERMLVRSGIHLIKLWFSVSQRRAARPASRSARSTRSGSGSSRPTDLASPATSGTTTPRRRRRCSSTPTPPTRRGRW